MNMVKRFNAQPLIKESVLSITAIGSQPATKKPGKNGTSATIDLSARHRLAIYLSSNSFSNAVNRLEISVAAVKPVGIASAARSSKMILPKQSTQPVPSTRNHWNGEMRRTCSFVYRTSRTKLKLFSTSLISLHQQVGAKKFRIS